MANVETAGIYPDAVKWTKDDHTRPVSFTAYAWDSESIVSEAHYRMVQSQSRRPCHGQSHRLSDEDRAMNFLLVIVIQASFYALLGMGYVLIYRATGYSSGARRPDGLRRLLVFSSLGGLERKSAPFRHRRPGWGCGAGRPDLPGIMRPLAGYPVAVGVLATIALGILLRSITTFIWSGQTRYPAEYLGQLGRPSK